MAEFDETFDWVVVGSGAGSMSSALLMKQAGKSVVILEKAEWVGGTTCKSGGVMWIPNNPFMDPGEDSFEKAITYLDAVVPDGPDSPGTSPERRAAYAENGPKMVEFLVNQGVALERGSRFWPDYYDELPGGCKTSRTVTAVPFNKKELPGGWAKKLRQGFLELPARLDDASKVPWMKVSWESRKIFAQIAFKVVLGKLTGKQWVTAGAALQGRMLKAVLEKNAADIRLECPVKEIIVENSKALGVVAVQNGKEVRIGANIGVLVNAGGFSMNQAMRDKYMPKTKAKWSNGIESNTGDMHVELERIGGTLAHMDEMVGFPMTEAPGGEDLYVKFGTQNVTARPHCIQVDQSGVRYMNEASSYELICETQIKRDDVVGAIPSYAIMDQRFIDKYPLANKQGSKIPQSWYDENYIKQANTIEDLAKLLNMEPATLRGTIDRWNGFVDKGIDDDYRRGERAYGNWLGDPFNKDGPNQTMGKIVKAPFYAVEIVPGDVGTWGGVVTDTEARVVKEDGTPFEGLYACGITTASAMGRVYPGAGASVGPSMCFGWIAAKHAAGLGNQEL